MGTSSDGQLRPEPERRRRRGGSLAGGLILILLGAVFLAQQAGWPGLRNWWALFILVPAVINLGTAAMLFRRSGAFTQGVRATFFGGLITLAVALIFLLDLSWEKWWPVFVLLPGLGLLTAGLPLPGGTRSQAMNLFAGPWLFFTGLGVALLGLGFLGKNLGWFDLGAVMERWWAISILIAALGGIFSAFLLAAKGAPLAAGASLAGGLIVGAVGIAAWLGANWDVYWPVILIAFGGVLLLVTLGRPKT
jgi:hypothetical protein